MSASISDLYVDLGEQLRALLAGESDPIANAANAAALIYHGLPEINWAGFYFCNGAELVLGPFQGRPACVRIPVGSGVCGTAAARGASILVADVDEFPGHIACDPASRSELVVPLLAEGEVLGVLDLDSPRVGRFDETDRQGCERLAAILVAHRYQAPAGAGYPADVDAESGCRLPLPRPQDLDDAGRRSYDRLADPTGGTLRGLRGPGGIQLHSPALARLARPLNHYLRFEAELGGRVRELAILATARALDSHFEWAAHEPAALAEGISGDTIDIIRHGRDTSGLDPADAVVIELGREIFCARRLGPATFARASRQFGRRRLVDLVALMGNYAATAALLTAFDMQLDPAQPSPFPPSWR